MFQMIRKTACWICLMLLMPVLPVSQAAEIEASGTALRKMQRGFLNIAFSPWELAHELSQRKKTDSFIPTWFAGLGKGSIYTVGRASVGVYELVTFPIPLPSRYEPVIQPEFAWQYFDQE